MDELKNSIVHEYSILYTTRIIQKDKKWSDGKLKYYEFNNKLEIFNEDGQLIEVDFIGEKFKHNLTEQNEFKLPNSRLLIEIDCKLSSYVRDVSEFFKKSSNETSSPSIKREYSSKIKANPEPIRIKQERIIKPIIYRPLKHVPVKKTPASLINIKQEPQFLIKQEPIIPKSFSSHSPPVIKQEPIDRVNYEVKARKFEPVPDQKPRLKKETKRKVIPRIYPKSSRIFKHLSANQSLSASHKGLQGDI